MFEAGRIFKALITVLVVAAVFIPGRAAWAGSEVKLSKGQTVYVAVYSHIYCGDREQPFDLAVTLSIRNTDLTRSLFINTVDYYDSKGNLVKKYLDRPLELPALASVRYIIKESDRTGGSGANFIVKWEADQPVNVPLIESVMIGAQTQQGISFTSRGQVIEERAE